MSVDAAVWTREEPMRFSHDGAGCEVGGNFPAERLLRVTDALDGEDVLPGFRLPLAELFAELSFE